MPKERASFFGDVGDLDLKEFEPKKRSDTKAPSKAQVQAVAEAANFPSREASAPAPKSPNRRAPRIYRTGRNVQFSAKATQETVDTIYAITEANPGWVLGYTLERAVEALQRELEQEADFGTKPNSDRR